MGEKTRSFSIFLLKDGFDSSNCLEEDHLLRSDFQAHNLPKGATLFVLDNQPREPWWRSYFGVVNELSQQTKGALVILPVEDRHFALAFGHVQHYMVDGCYIYDFGLKVTLNSVDPAKRKSTDTIDPGASRRRRTQLPNESELTFFDFDRDSSVLKSLTGKVRSEFGEFFKHPTGSASLRLSTKTTADALPVLCQTLLSLYNSDVYLTTFPDIRSIEPVKDPDVILELDMQLESAIQVESADVILSVPGFLDYTLASDFTFSGLRAGKIYNDVYAKRYYEYVRESKTPISDITVRDLKKHKLVVLNENETSVDSFAIYKCVVFDTSLSGSDAIFHLNEGTWYKLEATLVAKLRAYLDPFCVPSALPDFSHASEGEYNAAVTGGSGGLINLDRTNISIAGQKQIEPCDLLDIQQELATFIHVKISTKSSTLSHLFAQGLASIEILSDEPLSVDNILALVRSRGSKADEAVLGQLLESRRIGVRYAIITHKNPSHNSDNLPIFSRLSLARTLRSLNRMGVKRELCFIKDATPTLPGKKRTRTLTGC